MKTTWSRPTKYLLAVSLVLLGIYILHLSRSVIPLLVVAALIAVIVRPVILWLHRRLHLPRGPAVALVYLCLAILGDRAYVAQNNTNFTMMRLFDISDPIVPVEMTGPASGFFALLPIADAAVHH